MLPEQKKQNDEEKHSDVPFRNKTVKREEQQAGYRLVPQAPQ